jgi:hypothetical protein
MKNKLNLWLAALPILGVLGCQSGKNLNQANVELIDRARSTALSEAPGLDEDSVKAVSQNIPKRTYYRMAGDFAAYSFRWKISSNRTLVLFGEGDVQTLENHKVTIHDGE